MADDIGLFEAIYTQKAIRRLKPDPVPDELIDKLLDAAIRAPSGGNQQPWSFIVIKDPETKKKIGEWYLDAWNQTYDRIPQEQRDKFEPPFARVYRSAQHLAHHMGEAPVQVLVCARATPVPNAIVGASHYGSIFPAVQNLLLAARGLGLGACLTTLHKMHEQEVKDLLGIPENIETVALIPVGYPLGRYGPVERRPVEEVVHRERWDASRA